jgi:site-specific recombinase XerD
MDRKLGVTHMAFYRGWLQGLPLEKVADLYLETGLDLRIAKSTLRWVQDMLRRTALRHGRHGEARLLRLKIEDTHAVSAQAPSLPSIDDFREDFDPTGFYSYDELMTHYLERFPQAGNDRARKRARLLERQLRTLNWLEGLLVTSPVPADPIEAWFDDVIIWRLKGADIRTLGDLLARIKDRGYHWYKTVPQLGETRANRLITWLETYRDSLGAIPAAAKVKPRSGKKAAKVRSMVIYRGPEPAAMPGSLPVRAEVVSEEPDSHPAPLDTPIVPLEAVLLPDHRDLYPASHGWIPQDCMIQAHNDREAILEWLRTKSGSPATERAYRKEAERLVIWAMIEHGKTLADLRVTEANDYREFLQALGRVSAEEWKWTRSQEDWQAPRNTPRHSDKWRPFEGKLSSQSVNYALNVCKALMAFLAAAGYVQFNPFAFAKKIRPLADDIAPDIELTRRISRFQWDVLMEAIERISDEDDRLRAQAILRLALVTGLRLAELVGARWGRVKAVTERDGRTRWKLTVLGKGGKWRDVPIVDDVMVQLREWMRRRDLPVNPGQADDETPIIARKDGMPITESGLYWLIKQYFALGHALMTERGHDAEAAVFEKASTHWIRHSTGSIMADEGVPPTHIQKLLGHVSVATTSIYTDTSGDEIHKAVSKTFGKPR